MKKAIGVFIGIILMCFIVIVALNEKTNTTSTVPTKPITTTAITTTINKRGLPDDTERISVYSSGYSDINGVVTPTGPFYFCWNYVSNYEIIDTSKIMIDGNGTMFIYGKDAASIIEEEKQKEAQERQQYEDNKNNVKPLFE